MSVSQRYPADKLTLLDFIKNLESVYSQVGDLPLSMYDSKAERCSSFALAVLTADKELFVALVPLSAASEVIARNTSTLEEKP